MEGDSSSMNRRSCPKARRSNSSPWLPGSTRRTALHCMWRAPQGDRRHVVLCLVAATLWFGLAVFEPRTRPPSFGFTVASFLAIGLFKALRGGAARLRPSAICGRFVATHAKYADVMT